MEVANLIGYVIAIAIPVLAIYLIYALDLFGTGKIGTVAICMAWGAIFAFGLAYIINTVMAQSLGRATVTTLTAPILEEILKSLILVYFVQSPRFRYVVDGAVYGFGVGIGFAVVENISYLSGSPNAGLTLAITRVLSTSLMHATASGMVGISLGRLRRAGHVRKLILPIAGILIAVGIHIGYNNVVNSPHLEGATLLLVAIALGIGGSLMIGFQINQGIADEKKSFSETLSEEVNVSGGERKAIQQLGGNSIEQVMEELGKSFGTENINQIRKLLVTQANIGILQNNLASTNVSARLRKAWEEEIAQLQEEVTTIRKELGMYVSAYMQSMFPTDDQALWNTINEEIASSDPTLVHTFDMFMRVSRMSEAFTPEQLEAMAERLHKISIFKYVSLADLENLSRAIEVVPFPGGQMLFDKGDEGDAMYLIENGQISIFTQDQDSREKLLRTFNPGDVVGDFAVLDGQPRSARARAVGQLSTLVLKREVFMMFIQSRPQVVLAVLQVLAEKARFTTRAVEEAVQSASDIAQGNYEKVFERTAATIPVPSAALTYMPEEDTGRTELTDKLPSLVGGAFAAVAASLQRRERSITVQPSDA
jgi:RsiW-degrading membrane proteinase PrsW (M82 family)/CRP-like cAMP-binding protein